MTKYSPTELVETLGTGLLSFPVTHFDADLQFDEPAYREHLAWLAGYARRRPVRRRRHRRGLLAHPGRGRPGRRAPPSPRPPARCPCSPRPRRHRATPSRRRRPPRRAGADGILLLPPYLTEAGQAGLVEHVSAVCAATDLGVIVYTRANAVLSADTAVADLADRCPNLVGFKDGVGDIEQMTRIYARLGDRLIYVGGLPTAEMFALPLPGAGRDHLLLGDLQLRARSARSTSTPPCARQDRRRRSTAS